jgi:hypothetical protein
MEFNGRWIHSIQLVWRKHSTRDKKLTSVFYLFIFIPVAPTLEHFVSLQFLNLRKSVGLLGQGISPSQGRYLHRTTQTQTDIHALSGIRTHDPSVRGGEDINLSIPVREISLGVPWDWTSASVVRKVSYHRSCGLYMNFEIKLSSKFLLVLYSVFRNFQVINAFSSLGQWFSTFVRPRLGKYCFL